MGWHQRMDDSLVIEVRAAEGRPPEFAKRFGLPPNTIWRIKRGITGSHVPYTRTVLLPEHRRGGGKLSGAQRTRIESVQPQDRESAKKRLAAECGITASRVGEIWLELDFMAAHWAAVSKADAEVIAGRVGEI
jgi:hypothetical protein